MKNNYFLSLLFLFTLMLAACGTEEASTSKEETEEVKTQTESVTASSEEKETEAESKELKVLDSIGQELVFEEAPATFAALSTGDLDIIHTLGGELVGRPTSHAPVADDLKSVQEIGNPHQPNFEVIAGLNPDVLVASPSFQAQAHTLESQGTKIVYTQANSIEDITNTITLFGTLLNKGDQAEEIVEGIQKEIGEKIEGDGVRSLLVYGAPGTYLAALPNSLPGDILTYAGGVNIASAFPQHEEYPQYATLNVERIIEQNPEVVYLITHGEPEAVKAAFEEEMSQNAAWKNLDAVKNGNVVILPSHLFGTNPGTKITESVEFMRDSVNSVRK
ncbi:ABC transporter substrate-binding protein [Bacillus sp. AK031]